MRKFGVLIEGRNFLIAGPDGEAKHGFHTARFVEAPNPQAAEDAAIAQLRARDSLHEMVLNRDDDPPMMYVTEIYELEEFEGTRSPGDQGLIWYDESDAAEAD
jgi:hypothetical protein